MYLYNLNRIKLKKIDVYVCVCWGEREIIHFKPLELNRYYWVAQPNSCC